MTHTGGKSREEDVQTGVGWENTVIMRRKGNRNTHTQDLSLTSESLRFVAKDSHKKYTHVFTINILF